VTVAKFQIFTLISSLAPKEFDFTWVKCSMSNVKDIFKRVHSEFLVCGDKFEGLFCIKFDHFIMLSIEM